MGWALVFSGQGLQHPDMLPWLSPDGLLATLAQRLGPGWRADLADPQRAGDNRRTQLLQTATACAAWSQLQPQVEAVAGPPRLVIGYSVGELAACVAAGVLDAPTALDLATCRADAMDAAAHASPDGPTGLLGVSDARPAGLQALQARHDLDVAIRIDAGTAILGGRRADLERARAEAESLGWRCTPLNIALASHTRWMTDAAASFASVLADLPLRRPDLPLFSPALGRIRDADAARDALARQLASTVAWDEAMEALAAQRLDAVLEIGPGQALARMWRDRHPDVPARSADEFRSAAAIVNWLGRQVAGDPR